MAALEIVQSVFASVWSFFTDITVPGLGVSFAALFLAVVLVKLSLAVLRHGFGIGNESGYRSGSTRNAKISNERKGDEF